MSVAPVLTQGVGFGGAAFLPTLGFSSGEFDGPGLDLDAARRVAISGSIDTYIRIAGSAAVAVTTHIELYESEDVVLEIDCGEDMTGEEVSFVARDGDGGAAVITRTTAAGHIAPDAADPEKLLVALPSAATAVAPGLLWWSCAKTGTGERAELANGRLRVRSSQAL